MNEVRRGFKAKTIIKIIRNKIDGWLKTISDEELRKDLEQNYIVTGGAIASMLQGDLPNDYDIYFQTPLLAKRVADYYLKDYVKSDFVGILDSVIEDERVRIRIKSAGVILGNEEDALSGYDYFESCPPDKLEEYLQKHYPEKKGQFKPLYITSNAITLDDDIQLCLRFTGNPHKIHENYDFVHTTNFYCPPSGLVLHKEALESILARELHYVGSLYPLCSLFRIKKFIQRGWTITAGEMLKIAWDINKLNLNNINVLQEQLIGVDQAYFTQLIQALQASDGDIDRTYLFTMINVIFDNSEIEDFNDQKISVS